MDGRREAEGLVAPVHLEEVEGEAAAGGEIGADGEEAGDLVVEVGVERPVREDDVRGLGQEELAEAAA